MALRAGNGADAFDARVIDAFGAVPREFFVPPEHRHRAYDDTALPIGEGQTISQPLVVALMIDALEIMPQDRVLEVGSGSGYAAAVLSLLAREVTGIERVAPLRARAERTLIDRGYSNVRIYPAGPVLGRREDAPYDAVLVSAGAPNVPRALIDQLTKDGRMVVPVGPPRSQELVRVNRTPHGTELMRLGPCAFVPLIGDEAWPG
jgi:protein-L-isoaspartate(D-aspartate) O-methyltransferase